MYSGFDTDAMVQGMLAPQQSKIDKQYQNKTSLEWYNEALTDVMDSVKEFANTYTSVLGSSSMLKSSKYSSYNVSSDSTSKAVTISASGSADEGNVSVMVSQLAVNANISSSGKVSKDGTAISSSNTATLDSLSFANKLKFDEDGEICFAINGKTFTFDKKTTLQSMINTINNDQDANVTMKYSRLTDSFTLTADSGGKNSKVSIQNITGNAFGADSAFQIDTVTVTNGRNSIAEINGTIVERDSNEFTEDGITYRFNAVTSTSGNSLIVKQLAKSANASSSGKVSANGTEIAADNNVKLSELSLSKALVFDDDDNISFRINGKTFTFNKDTTLQNMLDTINNDENANVTMQYSRLNDTFTLTSDSSGKDSRVSVFNVSGNAFGADSAFKIGTGFYENGQNSIAVIKGVTVERTTNNYTIDGTAYDLTDVTDVSKQYINFTIEKDYSATKDSITSFVTDLNKLLTKLNKYLEEEDKSYDYKPLTEAQMDEMSEDQIKKWNENAKSGLLKNNTILQQLLSGLKEAFFTAAGGTGSSATSIGISTGSLYGSDKGLLVIDENALSAAIAKNPEKVISMFTGGKASSASADQGIIYKIINSVSAFKKSASDSISNTDDKIDDYDVTIDKLEDKLDSLADKYYKQFSAMESSLAQLNSQASYLSQLFQ
jgi:flagellar hook-associated protein 2